MGLEVNKDVCSVWALNAFVSVYVLLNALCILQFPVSNGSGPLENCCLPPCSRNCGFPSESQCCRFLNAQTNTNSIGQVLLRAASEEHNWIASHNERSDEGPWLQAALADCALACYARVRQCTNKSEAFGGNFGGD